MVRLDAEMKKWELLSYLYMTELSDDPNDENAFIERHLPWRSQSKTIFALTLIIHVHVYTFPELNDYIKILDQRLQEKERKDLCGAVSKKLRTLGHPSEQKKPVGPAWAIAAGEQFLTFMYIYVHAGTAIYIPSKVFVLQCL